MKNPTINLTEGSVLKNSIKLSWPMLVSYILQVTVSLVDLKMISSLGTEEIAAVGLSQQFIIFAFLTFTAVSVGASIYLSQYTGRNDLEKVRETVVQTILLSIIIGSILSLISIFSLQYFINLMSATKPVLIKANMYASIVFYFAPAMLLNYTLNAIFRSTGDSKTPLYIMLVINVLNITLNYILIFGMWGFPKMGLEGAALGTGIARTLGAFISIYLLYRKNLLFKISRVADIFTKGTYAPRFGPMSKIFVLGLPSAMQDISWSVSMLVIYKILSMMNESTAVLSAFSIAFNVEAICFMPGIAFMQAATIMVGQHLGAGNVKNAQRAAWINVFFGSVFMAVLGIPFFTIPDLIVGFFTNDLFVLKTARSYLIIMGALQLFLGVKFILIGAINGTGDTKTPFYIEFSEHWLLRTPLIALLVLVLGFGATSVWLTLGLTNVITAVVLVFLFKSGYWKKKRLLDKKL